MPRYGWQDIILPDDQLALLHEIVNTVRGRPLVLDEWGVGRKLASSAGVPILFAGPPGTGKTMAAEIIAAELGLDLYKIDLSTVVSKYIGETEKNLERIFDEAESSNAILFFDEARCPLRQALRGEGRPRPLRQHRDQLPAAAHGGLRRRDHPGHQPARQPGRGLYPPAALRRGLPLPRGGRPAAHLAHPLPARRPA